MYQLHCTAHAFLRFLSCVLIVVAIFTVGVCYMFKNARALCLVEFVNKLNKIYLDLHIVHEFGDVCSKEYQRKDKSGKELILFFKIKTLIKVGIHIE